MADARTVLVDELVDRQKLTGRNYFVLGLLLVALLCDGFDLQLVAFAAPRIARDWGIAPEALKFAQVANLLGMMIGAMFLVPFAAGVAVPFVMLMLWLQAEGDGFRSQWWWILLAPIGVHIGGQILDDYIRPLKIPAYRGAMIGHIRQQFILPVGVKVEMDADAGTLRMLEPAFQA